MAQPVIYRCAECGRLVVREGDKLTRSCGHEQKPVTADLSATAHGEGRAEG